jgi:hypothetical protein
MYIKLGQEDYDAIAELVTDMEDGDGMVEYCDLIDISFSKTVRAERDDDYFNGTGAWGVKSVEFSLGDVKCGDIEIRYSHERLEKTIEEMLWRS